MAVDEKKLGDAILANGSLMLPGVFLFITHFMLAGNQWFIALEAFALAAYYNHRRWDGRHLLLWGVAAFALSAAALAIAKMAAQSMAVGGYWLCLAGLLTMAVEHARNWRDTAGAGNASRGRECEGASHALKNKGKKAWMRQNGRKARSGGGGS